MECALMQPRLRSHLEDWWRRKKPVLAPRTAVVYEAAMKKLPEPLLSKRLGRVLPRDIEEVLLPLSSSYRKQVKAVLGQVFEDARRNRLCEHNPVSDADTPVRQPRTRMAVEPREVDRIVLAAPEPYKALILVAAYGGLRLGEALALTPEDIRLDAETIRVSKQWDHISKRVTPPKTEAGDRVTVFSEKIRDSLEYHLDTFSTWLVFPSKRDYYTDPNNFRARVWRKLTKYHFHDLRHTFASILIRDGVNPAMIAKLMGHSDPSVTLRIYAHFFQDDYADARRALAK